MKKFILILIITTTHFLQAQNWNYESGGSAFDGKYKTASVLGKGTDFPYHKPLLVINLFNEKSLNFYIAEAGYYQSLQDIEILWILNNDSNTQYKSFNFTKSADGKTLFLDDFKNLATGEYLFNLDFIEKLKSANKIDVRIKNKYGKNDITFSLSGSTEAINYVISKKYKDEVKSATEEIERLFKEEMEKTIKMNTRIRVLIIKAGIMDQIEEGTDLIDKIKDNFDKSNLEISDIDSLDFEFSRYSTDLNLFKNNGELIKKIRNVDYIIPNYIKSYKESNLKRNYSIIEPLIAKYDLNDKEKGNICESIIYSSETNKFNIKEIDSVNLNLLFIINRSIIELFNSKKEKFESIEINIPDYLKKAANELEKKGLNRVSSLLEKYNFTQSEKDKIIVKLIGQQLQDIEQEMCNKLMFEFSSYVTNIKFLNNDKKITEVSIYEADFSKQLKKKVKNLK